ncbi:MAG: hypothetical protein ACKO45_10785 [Cyanobium sp.]
MTPTLSPADRQILEALQQAVTAELVRKARLGHYAVIWQDGRAVMQGPDAPQAPADLAAMDPVDGEP